MCVLLMFQNDFHCPQQTLPEERIGHGLLSAHVQMFHLLSPPSAHSDGGKGRKLRGGFASAIPVSA